MANSVSEDLEDKKLEVLAQDFETFQNHLQKLVASSKQCSKSGSLSDSIGFAEELVGYYKNNNKAPEYKTVATIGATLETIEQSRNALLEQLSTQVARPMETFLKNDTFSVMVLKEKVLQAKEEYLQSKLKFELVKSMVSKDQLLQYERTLAETKKNYDALAAKYFQKLDMIETKKKFEVFEKLASFTLQQLEFYRKAVTALSSIEPQLKTTVAELSQKRAKFLETHADELEVSTNLQDITKCGFLMVKENDNWERRWVVVANGFLYIYKDWKDAHTLSSHILLSSSVKKNGLELTINVTVPVPLSITLQSTADEVDSWVSSLQNTITTLIALYKDKRLPTTPEGFIKGNLQHISESFATCADCEMKDPEFVTLRFGSLICSSCANCHKKLGVSPVKSVFENRLEPEELQMLSFLGNEKVNSILEQKISLTKHIAKPKEDSDSEVKEAYIKAKYFKNKFVNVPEMKDDKALTKDLLEAIETNDIVSMFRYLIFGANANKIVNEIKKTTLLHHCIIEGKINLPCLALLLRNEANLNVKDGFERTPIHYAASQNKLAYIRLLVSHGASLTTKDADGTSPAMIVRSSSGPNAKVVLTASSSVAAEEAPVIEKSPTPAQTKSEANVAQPEIKDDEANVSEHQQLINEILALAAKPKPLTLEQQKEIQNKEEQQKESLAKLKTVVSDTADLLKARLNVLRQELQKADSKDAAKEIANTVKSLKSALE